MKSKVHLKTCRNVSALVVLSIAATACRTKDIPEPALQQATPRPLVGSLRIPDGYHTGPVVAGLEQGAIPQGLVYLPQQGLILTSHYFDDHRPSCVVSTDWETGRALNTVQLLEPDGQPHFGHVGGLAVGHSNLWIASDGFLYRGRLADCTEPTGSTFQTLEKIKTECSNEVAFCSFFNDRIWAGEFALGNKYATPATHHLTARDGSERHGWVCGYDPENGFVRPEYVLSIPDRAQGMLLKDNYILLSRSYGRRSRSSIEIFRNPISEPPHHLIQTMGEPPVPLWFLDGANHVRSIDLPPMAENMALADGQLLVLFESGAQKFRWFGRKPLDYTLLFNLKELQP
ncbi:hypothetical protein P4B35_19010 [Pontiellaceae bacterium B12227]|nr:hypothetical protein [Pontiellaceae bacterium B12227]